MLSIVFIGFTSKTDIWIYLQIYLLLICCANRKTWLNKSQQMIESGINLINGNNVFHFLNKRKNDNEIFAAQ